MNQESLFYEDFYDAMRTAVMALGGAKKVGPLLWPEKSIDAARTRLLNCLKENRDEVLRPEQVLLLAKLARAGGCHAIVKYFNQQAGYADPQPIEPEDERQRIQREFVAGMADMKTLLARLEQLEGMK